METRLPKLVVGNDLSNQNTIPMTLAGGDDHGTSATEEKPTGHGGSARSGDQESPYFGALLPPKHVWTLLGRKHGLCGDIVYSITPEAGEELTLDPL